MSCECDPRSTVSMFCAVQLICVFIDKHADPYKQSSTQMNTILFDIIRDRLGFNIKQLL